MIHEFTIKSYNIFGNWINQILYLIMFLIFLTNEVWGNQLFIWKTKPLTHKFFGIFIKGKPVNIIVLGVFQIIREFVKSIPHGF